MTDARMQGRFWPDTRVPRRLDGSVDVLAVCRWLDEQANAFPQVRPYLSNTGSTTMGCGPGTPASAPALVNPTTDGADNGR